MRNYLLKCLYKIKKKSGQTKVKKEAVYLRLKGTPKQLHGSSKLHIYLGKAIQRNNTNKVLSVEIKEIIELQENEEKQIEPNKSKQINNCKEEADRCPQNKPREVCQISFKKFKNRES